MTPKATPVAAPALRTEFAADEAPPLTVACGVGVPLELGVGLPVAAVDGVSLAEEPEESVAVGDDVPDGVVDGDGDADSEGDDDAMIKPMTSSCVALIFAGYEIPRLLMDP